LSILGALGIKEAGHSMVHYDSRKEIDVETLRIALSGKSKEISKALALSLLGDLDYTNKLKDLQAILENENESKDLRTLSAYNLARSGQVEAEDILIKNLQIADERVLAGVVEALGQVGESRAIPPLLTVKNTRKGNVFSRANFAVTLISYRLGLPGNELTIPTEKDYLKMSDDSKPITISKASRDEINKFVSSLSDRRFGIEFATESAYQVVIGRDTYLVLPNKRFSTVEDAKALLQVKSVLGIVSYKSEEHQSYSVKYLVLGSPAAESKESIDLIIVTPSGDIMFGGLLNVKDTNVTFSIRSISRPGGFPLIIRGNFFDQKLNLDAAKYSASRETSKQPTEVS
jgi:HEAT repeats